MKNFLSNLLKGIGVITLATGFVLAIDLGIGIDAGKPMTKNIWDKVVLQLETNTDSITSITNKTDTNTTDITDLLAEINTLKTQVSNIETSTTSGLKGTVSSVRTDTRCPVGSTAHLSGDYRMSNGGYRYHYICIKD